ncbi:hypothetical protein OH492_14155 [Vibrio chagasii]|nr:hypothetical protein [Vibrio chagasii]
MPQALPEYLDKIFDPYVRSQMYQPEKYLKLIGLEGIFPQQRIQRALTICL